MGLCSLYALQFSCPVVLSHTPPHSTPLRLGNPLIYLQRLPQLLCLRNHAESPPSQSPAETHNPQLDPFPRSRMCQVLQPPRRLVRQVYHRHGHDERNVLSTQESSETWYNPNKAGEVVEQSVSVAPLISSPGLTCGL